MKKASNKRLTPAARLTSAAMATALGVLFMFAASVLPAGRLAFLFLASVVIWIPLNERGGFPTALLCYLATAGLTFLLVSNKMYAGAYLIFFGLYGFIKLGVDMLIPDRVIAFVVKLIIMNGLAALALLLATLILQQNVFSLIPEYPLYIAIPVLEAAFIIYELLYSFMIAMFDDHLRDALIPRR
ncbi:MAG: hypothetical protein IJM20_07080 [Clostridia bacterium]|jgi:hypothetical protein|nr:hypothetical protein [Clostridia bacterium]